MTSIAYLRHIINDLQKTGIKSVKRIPSGRKKSNLFTPHRSLINENSFSRVQRTQKDKLNCSTLHANVGTAMHSCEKMVAVAILVYTRLLLFSRRLDSTEDFLFFVVNAC
jgi:hypothetical protein